MGTGARTVPRIFTRGMCIGGRDDLRSMLERGETWRFKPMKKKRDAKARRNTTRRPVSQVDLFKVDSVLRTSDHRYVVISVLESREDIEEMTNKNFFSFLL